MKKIGILGGSFNPIHAGHIYIAKQALVRLNLQEIWFLPAKHNPFKSKKDLLPFDDRVKLIEQKIKQYPQMKVSRLEQKVTSCESYKVIDYIVNQYNQNKFVWIMGDDNLKHLHRWKRADDILKLITIAIFARKYKLDFHKQPWSVKFAKYKTDAKNIKLTLTKNIKIQNAKIQNSSTKNKNTQKQLTKNSITQNILMKKIVQTKHIQNKIVQNINKIHKYNWCYLHTKIQHISSTYLRQQQKKNNK